MSVTINGDTGIDKITDGSIVAADISTGAVGATQLASTLDLSGKTVTLATDAAVVSKLSTASGSAPSYSARAWVSWQGQGTVSINASGNVSSITDNGTGDYTINFTTAMPDANYCYTSSGKETSSNNNRSDLIVTARASDTMLAGSARMTTVNASVAGIFDAYTACVAFFR